MHNPNEHKKTVILEPLTIDRIRDLWSRTCNQDGKPDWSRIFPYYLEDRVVAGAPG